MSMGRTSLIKAISLIVILLTSPVFTACTTIQTRSGAVAELKDVSLDNAISISTQAALAAGFTIVSMSKESALFWLFGAGTAC
jgi:hypothetical protein